MMRELSDVHHLRLHDPMSLQHLLFLLLLHLILIHSSEGADSKPSGYKFNDCPKDSNYTTNSTFQANLNLLLPSLSSAAVAATGYFNTTVGQPPDQVYGHALCRSDFSPSVCQDCLVTAAQAIVELCPAGKQSTMAYDDCIVRYSDESFFGTADVNPVIYVYITQNVSDPQAFESLLGNFMNGLETEATKDSSKLFAAGAVNMTSFTDVYGLVQCTRDLPAEECSRCINIFIGKLSLCCQYKTGGAVYGRSCFIRYDFDLFYNITAVYATNSPPQPPPPQPPPPPPPQLLDSGPEAPKGGKSNHSTKLALTVAIPLAASLVLLLFSCILYLYRRSKQATEISSRGDDSKLENLESLIFNLGIIRLATKNFSDENKLGEGGFGSVYKGTLPGGDQIAVKRLSRRSGQGITEMKNEVVLVAKLNHRNLVKMWGWCIEEDEKLLVYEYLPNTSLDKYIFGPIRKAQLDWPTRYKIIEGIGRGLLYLHQDARLKIIHRDLKASNILLDGDMKPKISDFGLAKIFGVDESQREASRVAGTYGYMAPEYALEGIFSSKSDVFSFGILILEIVTGRRNTDYQVSETSATLVTYVWRHWSQREVLKVIDHTLGRRFHTHEVLRSIHLALLCIQENPTERPSMATVMLMLNSYSTILPTPSIPAFVLQDNRAIESYTYMDHEDRNRGMAERSERIRGKRKSGDTSKNVLSISDMEPR